MRKLKDIKELQVGQHLIIFGKDYTGSICASLAVVINEEWVKVKNPWDSYMSTIPHKRVMELNRYCPVLLAESSADITDKMVSMQQLKREIRDVTEQINRQSSYLIQLEKQLSILEEGVNN